MARSFAKILVAFLVMVVAIVEATPPGIACLFRQAILIALMMRSNNARTFLMFVPNSPNGWHTRGCDKRSSLQDPRFIGADGMHYSTAEGQGAPWSRTQTSTSMHT
ncbi:hypothetical protein HAX54_050537 [Datura stramonium]|uniref:Secreted protein n=1 Tax=Datura stramonium TaxID=4076 RepID=A0ABS8WP59_DATST|nr:hypothetical protein [Datura stramonium]